MRITYLSGFVTQRSLLKKDLTDLLVQACRLMHTPVLDHAIITEHSYYSLSRLVSILFQDKTKIKQRPFVQKSDKKK